MSITVWTTCEYDRADVIYHRHHMRYPNRDMAVVDAQAKHEKFKKKKGKKQSDSVDYWEEKKQSRIVVKMFVVDPRSEDETTYLEYYYYIPFCWDTDLQHVLSGECFGVHDPEIEALTTLYLKKGPKTHKMSAPNVSTQNPPWRVHANHEDYFKGKHGCSYKNYTKVKYGLSHEEYFKKKNGITVEEFLAGKIPKK